MKPTIDDIEAEGGFPIVYADPPWNYDQRGRGAARNHYSTMTQDELRALPVRRLMSRNAVLFLWATMPLLPEAIELGESWCGEMAYKTVAFTWIKYHEPSGKPAMGGGMWTRANAELCLLFVRGEPPRRVSRAVRQLIETGPEDVTKLGGPCDECGHSIEDHTEDNAVGSCRACLNCDCPTGRCECSICDCYRYGERAQQGNVLRAPRGRHSAKPAEVRRRIDDLMGPDLPRVELFARERAPGWDAWGLGLGENGDGSDFVMAGVG